MDTIIKYVIYYPSKGIGGAQLLFARIAEGLLNKGYLVLIVEKQEETCFITKYLKNKNLSPLVLKTSQEDTYCSNENDILFLSLSDMSKYQEAITPSDQTRLVFWDLHPFNLIEQTGFSKLYKSFPSCNLNKILKFIEQSHMKKLKEFIEVSTKNKAVYFMCLYNYNTNKDFLNLNINPIYLPIPVTKLEEVKLSPTVKSLYYKSKELNIAWISRMDKSKVAILDLLITDIIKYNSNVSNQIQLHIIGDKKEFYKNTRFNTENSNNFKFPGIIFDESLSNYLEEEKINMGFSMGTSALEFASRGIITVLVPSMVEFVNFKNEIKRYMFLSDASGCDLATHNYYIGKKARSFNDIILEINNNHKFRLNENRQYFEGNHSFDKILNKFIYFSTNSTMTFFKINQINLQRYSFMQKFIFWSKSFYKKQIAKDLN